MEGIIIAIFASSGFWTLVLYFVQKKDRDKNATTAALLGLLHDRIYEICTEAILRGYTSFSEYDNVINLWNPYAALGGNGTGKVIFEEFSALPKQPPTEEDSL